MQTSGVFPDLNTGMTKSGKKKQAFPAYYKQNGLPRGKTPAVPSVGRRRRGSASGGGSNPFSSMMPLINKAVRGA